ncbi:MAG: ABC transporter permease [Sulfurimonas sp.]|uniref:ABC transporter permease n=1 Tax=Sulfurimonas sp. TaxID=2022749 RepID=UPI00262AB566|nr:ABC transporter permease [Sulfurimonas sp.]MDD5373382.1 ABC transporter permease [Sulfurimonas sp.]
MIKKKIQTYGYLIKELSVREIYSKYKGSLLGIFWAVLTPLAMLFVFSFVFGEIFRAKWPGSESGSKAEFAINLYIGLSVFWFFADVLGKAPSLIVSVPNFVKKVVFPLEILPVVSLLSALFHLCINIVIITAAVLITKGGIPLSVVVLPIVMVVTFPLLAGAGLLFGALGVYARDIATVMGVVINMLMFLSPVFYPLSAIPQNLQWLFELNPVTLIIESCRGAFMYGVYPEWGKLGVYLVCSLLVWFLGYKVFNATRGGFGDVI